MLSNSSKVIKGQRIQWEKDKERNRLYLEIAQTLKDNQIKRKQKRRRREELKKKKQKK